MTQPTVDDYRIGDYVRIETAEVGALVGLEGKVNAFDNGTILVRVTGGTGRYHVFLPGELTVLHSDVDWCESCHTRQPSELTPTGRVCLECGHVYVDAQDLLDADNKLRKQIADEFGMTYTEAKTTDEVICCPCCTHNF